MSEIQYRIFFEGDGDDACEAEEFGWGACPNPGLYQLEDTTQPPGANTYNLCSDHKEQAKQKGIAL